MADIRYDTNNKGTSPALSHLLNEYAKMPRSTFDESRRKYFDAFPYAIIPVECFPMLPNSDVDVEYDVSIITKNPTIRRILSGCTVELATYRVQHNADLWEGWNNFITTGRTGKVTKVIPRVDFSLGTNGSKTTLLPYSPYAFMNILPSVFLGGADAQDTDKWSIDKNSGLQTVADVQLSGLTNLSKVNWFDSDAIKVSALPSVMYTKVAKQFQNPNVLQDNKDWYPENEMHDTILPYDIPDDVVTCASYDNPQIAFDDTKHQIQPNEQSASTATADKKGSAPWLNTLYYKMRRGNYFNTGSPFPDLIRGDMPTFDVVGTSLNWDNVFGSGFDDYLYTPIGMSQDNDALSALRSRVDQITASGETKPIPHVIGVGLNNPYSSPDASATDKLVSLLSKATVRGLTFNLNQWRRLAALTVFRERMARTDGSYNQMIQAQFQYNPKWHEHDVIYCGGSTQPIVFSEVVQTSGDNEASPLGTTGGRAVSAMRNKSIHIHSDDFSMFMTVLTITPDDVYSQGVERLWSELTQSEQYFPILNNLEPQAVKNKELFISGDNSVDEDVFNYQERFAHLKSRRNQVSGLMALPISKIGDTGAFLFNRLFGSTPQFNQSFVQGEFTDNENLTFTSMSQAQFAVTLVSNMRYTAPVPAVTAPSDMGISY